jgi:hypothetical protein
MRPVPELLDDDLAKLVRARLDARQPRRLPERFVPPAARSHRPSWAAVAAAAVALVVLALAGTEAAKPDLAPAILSGLRHQRPAASPTPAPGGQPPNGVVPAPAPGAGGAPAGGTAAPAPQPTPGGGPGAPGGAPAPAPAPQPSSGGGGPVPVPVPSLPVPVPSVPPLPVPTPSLPPVPLPSPLPSLPVR